MPELPEVEHMVRRLRGWTIGKTVNSALVERGSRYLATDDEMNSFVGCKIKNVTRRGKFIVFRTDRGLAVGHNAMSGYWDVKSEPWTFDYVEGSRSATDVDVRVHVQLSGNTNLRFHDSRLFGSLKFYQTFEIEEVKSLKDLGPEAVRTECAEKPEFNWNVLDVVGTMADSKHPIKQLLLDQHHVAGIGNIYAAEGLWRAKVNPNKPGKDLTKDDIVGIVEGCQEVLKAGLDKDLKYDSYLKVYRRKTCERCSGSISSEEIKGRNTYYCKGCQK